jgi:alpha-beta hydrolase superfamily lysophospholipase
MNHIEKIRKPFFFRIVKKPFFGRYQKPWRWPSDYTNREDWKPVKFTSQSSSLIRGLYAEAKTSDIKGTIVCSHPMGIIAKGFFLRNGIADRFRNHGYNVMIFDFNGFGESTDGDMFLNEDIAAAGLYARSINPGLPVGIYGISFGASMSVCAFSRENNPYKAALMESPFTTLGEYWGKFPIPSLVLKACTFIFPEKERRVRPIYHVGKIKNTTNILWVYSDSDTDTPVEMGIRLRDKCNIESQILIIPGARHAYCYDTDRETFFNAAIDFFDRHMK